MNCDLSGDRKDQIMIAFFNYIQTKIYKPLINSISGVAISLFNPFKEGDFIEIDGKLGSVENLGIRRTAIKTPEGQIATIENRHFYLKQLHNLSSENIIRLDLKLTVHLDTNMKELKDEILTFLSDKEYILNSPSPKIQVTKIQRQHIDLLIRPWCLLDDFLELDTKLEKLLTEHITKGLIEIKTENSFIPERKLMAS